MAMNELVSWYNKNENVMHPVVLAAMLHYKFVRIHPFDDGNGRTARLLMNFVLIRSGLPLVVIKTENKKDYLFALNQADAGNLNAFVNYIGRVLLWSLDLCVNAAKGLDIDEDDDLDKEIELLNKELQGIPNEFDKRKSEEEVSEAVLRSIAPLFKEIYYKLNGVRALFVSVQEVLTFVRTYHNGNSSTIIWSFNDLAVNIEKEENPFGGNIKDILIDIECHALKKVTDHTDIHFQYSVTLEDYHYSLIDSATGITLIRLPYGRFYLDHDLKKATRVAVKKIVDDIKVFTGVK